jgi:hypothetical protein
MADIKIKFSPRFVKIIKKIDDEFENNLSYKILGLTDGSLKYDNILDIYYMDISKVNNCFDIVIKGKKSTISIAKFSNTYFPDLKITDHALIEFHTAYNSFKGEVFGVVVGTPIEHKPFVFNPKDVRSTFLSLVTKTYPMGHEEEVLQFLPKLETDIHGNYYKIIPGDKQTMFTSHLDTADWKQLPTKLMTKMIDNEEYIFTDGTSILGADDKAGVTIMLYMMSHNIPGLYYFFLGEEKGGIGSRLLAGDFDSVDYLKDIKRCISFDRRKTGSVITSQYGRVCCSDEFGSALCREYNSNGMSLSLDNTGIFTDSASFIDNIPECTNISVGYNNEHTFTEIQNITFLDKIAKASVKVEWSKLPTNRKVGINSEIIRKYRNLIQQIKKYAFDLDVKVVGNDGKVFIQFDSLGCDIKTIGQTLKYIKIILERYNINDTYVEFEETYIKIELK